MFLFHIPSVGFICAHPETAAFRGHACTAEDVPCLKYIPEDLHQLRLASFW